MAVELLRRRAIAWTRPAPMHDFADYDAYWQERQGLGKTMRRWELAADAIPDGASVLDVGCGSGEFLDYLMSRRPNATPTACDFSEKAIGLSERKGFADSFKLDLSREDIPGLYDYVTCFEVLEHIPNAEEALVRLRSAFRHRLIVSIPNVGYL